MIETGMGREFGKIKVTTNETELLEVEARMAADMVIKWGMIVAEPDGEDSSGREKTKLMSVENLVERAFRTAKLILETARRENLIHTPPTLKEIADFEKANNERTQ